ncbi:MAG: heme exporter protein CcmB [Acidimicrobiia bacterium]
MSTFWRHAAAVAGKDLRTELRAGEVLGVVMPFGAVALLLLPLAIGIESDLLRRVGMGVYWTISLLFGFMVPARRTASEAPEIRDMLALVGIDPAAMYLGRAAATTIGVLAVEIALLPVAIVLYDVTIPRWWWLGLLLPLIAVGLGLLGTLAARVAQAAAAGAMLVPLLVAPLAVPVLLAAAESLEGLRLDGDILGWLVLLIVMDLLLATAGVVSAPTLEEGTG